MSRPTIKLQKKQNIPNYSYIVIIYSTLYGDATMTCVVFDAFLISIFARFAYNKMNCTISISLILRNRRVWFLVIYKIVLIQNNTSTQSKANKITDFIVFRIFLKQISNILSFKLKFYFLWKVFL